MYGIYTYIWLIFMLNVGKYTIHGSYGIHNQHQTPDPWPETFNVLQPSNISTTRKIDNHEMLKNPHNFSPSKKKKKWYPMVSQVRCPDDIWMQISGPQPLRIVTMSFTQPIGEAGSHRSRVPRVSRIPKVP